jgi:hypothetical protein
MTSTKKTVNATATKSTIPSFDKRATVIIDAYKGFDKAQAKLSDTIAMTMQQHVDDFAVNVGRDKKACEMLKTSIVDSQIVIDADASGLMQKKTFTEYAQSAMRALHFNVGFIPTLKNNKDYKLPWSKKASDPVKKAGEVKTTDLPAFLETMKKAISQGRLLGYDFTCSLLLDACLELDPEFKE